MARGRGRRIRGKMQGAKGQASRLFEAGGGGLGVEKIFFHTLYSIHSPKRPFCNLPHTHFFSLKAIFCKIFVKGFCPIFHFVLYSSHMSNKPSIQELKIQALKPYRPE